MQIVEKVESEQITEKKEQVVEGLRLDSIDYEAQWKITRTKYANYLQIGENEIDEWIKQGLNSRENIIEEYYKIQKE